MPILLRNGPATMEKTTYTENSILLPSVILDRFDELFDMIEKDSENGRLAAERVAQYLGRTTDWLRRAISTGHIPFAFDNGAAGRNTSYIGVFPFFQFETQGCFSKEMLFQSLSRKK